MSKSFDAIFENGVLRPLAQLDLAEHMRVKVTLDGADASDWLDLECHDYADTQADPSVTLQKVREGLASIAGSMADDVTQQRADR